MEHAGDGGKFPDDGQAVPVGLPVVEDVYKRQGNTERQITEEQIRRFAENLKRQEYGAGTIENYVRSIRAFSVWCQGLPDKAGVLAWKAHLIDCYAPASVNAMLAGINCLFKFQGWSDCAAKPLRLQRRSFSIPERELSRDEYLRLIQTARASGNERLALVMETLCATGIREMCIRDRL